MWRLIENGNQLPNPFSTEQVIEHMTNNPKGTFMVWKSGMSNWADPKSLPEFKAVVPQPAAPQPAVPKPAAPQPQVSAPKQAAQHKPQAQAAAPKPAAPKPSAYQNQAGQAASAFFSGAASKFKEIHEGESTYAFLPHLVWIDGILKWFGNKVPSDKLDSFDELAKKWGNVGILGSVVAILIFKIINGIKTQFGSSMISAVVSILGLLIMQYIGIKFLDAGKALIRKSPTHLSSRSFLDSVGLVILLLIPSSLLGGIVNAVKVKSFLPFVVGLGTCILLIYILSVTMRPKTVNVTVAGDASAGQEAIAILSFFMKLMLRMVPLIFGVVNILAPFVLLYMAIAMMFSEQSFIYAVQGESVILAIFGAVLAPLITYLLFLILYLFIDVIQSILAIPVKVEELKGGSE
ncbi:MAG: hypothetical protein CSA81_07320 [Acidobacteria bacterium]|nr:MAG: hypothetical protein CSA81_07320 [Acidobacteriota bacterium]